MITVHLGLGARVTFASTAARYGVTPDEQLAGSRQQARLILSPRPFILDGLACIRERWTLRYLTQGKFGVFRTASANPLRR